VKPVLKLVLSCSVLAALVLAAVQGPDSGASQGGGEVTLVLKLPKSKEYPERKRGAKLTIDGKDHTEPKDTLRTVKVPLKPGQTTVALSYGFWPNNYTNIIRPRTLKVEKGKVYTLDLNKEDPNQRDHLEVIYVPTPNKVVDEMLKLAKVGPGDVVWDIGCGDGRLVLMAVEKYGAKKGVGIDISPQRIKESNENARLSKVKERVEFKVGDALKITDVSEASVVLLYVGKEINLRLRPVLEKTLKPGSRVVSHRFTMGDWKPDETRKLKAKNLLGETDDYEVHLWTIRREKEK
jgi:hypothetical protein